MDIDWIKIRVEEPKEERDTGGRGGEPVKYDCLVTIAAVKYIKCLLFIWIKIEK